MFSSFYHQQQLLDSQEKLANYMMSKNTLNSNLPVQYLASNYAQVYANQRRLDVQYGQRMTIPRSVSQQICQRQIDCLVRSSSKTSFAYSTNRLVNNQNSTPKWAEKDSKLAMSGNMFQRREDWSGFLSKLPINKQNTTHIRLDDEGPYGNDETRCFVLSHFSSLNIKNIPCVFCDQELIVYDRFPLVDGTLFMSPYLYNKNRYIPTSVSKKDQYIYAVCLKCLLNDERAIKCKGCHQSWSGGAALQIGTLYKYDVIAASPCCQMRVNCKRCFKPLTDLKAGGLAYFSMYSEEKECPNCKAKDLHFIKPLNELFYLKN